MREILFRGKRVDNGEWVYGWYCGKVCADFWARAKESAQIIDKEDLFWHEVIPETVGQYTGLTDKDGTKIFEGDIVRSTDRFNKFVVYFVEFKDGTFKLKQRGVNHHIYFDDLPEKYYRMKVISNIHDNKEMMEGEQI